MNLTNAADDGDGRGWRDESRTRRGLGCRKERRVHRPGQAACAFRGIERMKERRNAKRKERKQYKVAHPMEDTDQSGDNRK